MDSLPVSVHLPVRGTSRQAHGQVYRSPARRLRSVDCRCNALQDPREKKKSKFFLSAKRCAFIYFSTSLFGHTAYIQTAKDKFTAAEAFMSLVSKAIFVCKVKVTQAATFTVWEVC